MVVSSASCAGAQALSLAALYVRTGKARRVLAGGVEAPLTPSVIQGLDSAGILSRRNDDPAGALRPFDRGRDGTVVGEGGAILLLETEADAVKRGARILARLTGTGDAMEAHHPYALAPDGLAARAALGAALREAETDARSVDLVMSHGTGTRQNDAYEASVIASVLGTGPMVTATKPLTGHLLGGAGAIDAAAAVTSMAAGFVPAIANCDDPDVGLDLDLVRGAAREASPRVVAVMSHGLGGFSSALILRRA
jgi:3-oxoacyl-[acyl-carrier-protein] synthase II